MAGGTAFRDGGKYGCFVGPGEARECDDGQEQQWQVKMWHGSRGVEREVGATDEGKVLYNESWAFFATDEHGLLRINAGARGISCFWLLWHVISAMPFGGALQSVGLTRSRKGRLTGVG